MPEGRSRGLWWLCAVAKKNLETRVEKQHISVGLRAGACLCSEELSRALPVFAAVGRSVRAPEHTRVLHPGFGPWSCSCRVCSDPSVSHLQPCGAQIHRQSVDCHQPDPEGELEEVLQGKDRHFL